MTTFKDIVNAAQTALGVITAAGNIPGVDLIPYVGTVLKFIGYAKKAIDIGQEIAPTVDDFIDVWNNGLPPEAVRAELDAKITANHAAIQGFEPVPEEGEPE